MESTRPEPQLAAYQQNSNLQGGVQVMCMQPWFFSIGRLHFGQGLELANILASRIETLRSVRSQPQLH